MFLVVRMCFFFSQGKKNHIKTDYITSNTAVCKSGFFLKSFFKHRFLKAD